MLADIDECVTNKDICGTATCVNSAGNFTCQCDDGKVFEEKQCVGEWNGSTVLFDKISENTCSIAAKECLRSVDL